MADLTWMERAGCKSEDAELFFADFGDTRKAERALHICRSHCPVRSECFAWFEQRATAWTVAGGEHWIRRSGMVVPFHRSSTRKGCPICWGMS